MSKRRDAVRVDRRWIAAAAGLLALGVGMGAFGAHGLEGQVSPDRLATWATAARYHLLHALGLLIIAALPRDLTGRGGVIARWLLLAGILLFSGSLYLLVGLDRQALGAVTPVGGACWIAAWLTLAISALRTKGGGAVMR